MPTSLIAANRGESETSIVGVSIRAMDVIGDIRGSLCEIHRDEWSLAPRPVQWDFVQSDPHTLRGVHVHCRRWDYIIVLSGHATVGLVDIRREQPTFRRSMTIDMPNGRPMLVTIPPGVAHGIFANTALTYLYGLTVAWDGSDEDLGCRYDDPDLGIHWPAVRPEMLERDLDLPDFGTLVRQYAATTRVVEDSEKAPV